VLGQGRLLVTGLTSLLSLSHKIERSRDIALAESGVAMIHIRMLGLNLLLLSLSGLPRIAFLKRILDGLSVKLKQSDLVRKDKISDLQHLILFLVVNSTLLWWHYKLRLASTYIPSSQHPRGTSP
jgi:hypothetical protein